jgi:hypothetical protein
MMESIIGASMTQTDPQAEPNWTEVVKAERLRLELDEKSPRVFSNDFAARSFIGMNVVDAAYISEASERLARFDRLQRLIGLLAPGGTAPRTALEQIYIQSGTDTEESPIVQDLRHMLQEHWGEWTPALREAEGLPPVSE